MRKISRCYWIAIGSICVSLIGNVASAQYRPYEGYRPRPRPLQLRRHMLHGYLGGQLMGVVIAKQITDTTGYLGHGGGAGLFGGLRINPFFSAEFNWNITFHDETFQTATGTITILDSLYMNIFSLDGKLHIPTRGPVEPFIQGGVGFVMVGDTGTEGIFATGPTFCLGGGLDVWLGSFFSLGGRLLYRGFVFGDPDLPSSRRSDNFANGVSVDLNATFHF